MNYQYGDIIKMKNGQSHVVLWTRKRGEDGEQLKLRCIGNKVVNVCDIVEKVSHK